VTQPTVDVVDALFGVVSDQALMRLAERLAPYLPRVEHRPAGSDDSWLSTPDAAKYLGTTVNALHKLTAARTIEFHQAGPGCKCWFRRSALDSYRRGEAKELREG
jgi:excisionase family DNA binding protein